MTRTEYSCLTVSLLFIGIIFLSVLPAQASGPLAICESGVPYLWPNQGQGIPFNPDQGGLGPLNNADAVALVAESFQVWGDVATASVTYENAGMLPVDVDITNFFPFLYPLAPDGLSAIVFDENGEIFELLFGADSGILGFAGPEWLDPSACEIVEGVSFLNGPSFTDLTEAKDVMVHEFGHYTNLAHTVVNGQLFIGFGDVTSPDPGLLPPPDPFADIIETMYPFYFGPLVGMQTLHADDIGSLSTLYPAADFFDSTGTVSGTILAPNASTKLTGVNVIARNLDDPYADAVSAISSDFTDSTEQSDPVVGTYTINGLTPGARYVVFVGPIQMGGFSTPPTSFLPGPQEFYNGANESNDPDTDIPTEFEEMVLVAGSPAFNTDIIFNQWVSGEPLPVGDEGGVQVFLPFPVRFCGNVYESIFVAANGFVTFGESGPFISFAPSVSGFLSGPARIAPLWADLDASSGGVVSFTQSKHAFTVNYQDVPEYYFGGANSFKITFRRPPHMPHYWPGRGNAFRVEYGNMTAPFGIAGFSCGGAVTSRFETETDLTDTPHYYGFNIIKGRRKTVVFEEFGDSVNDLVGRKLFFTETSAFRDRFEPNDSIQKTSRRANRIHLPFDTISDSRFTTIEPAGDDVDYFKFWARAGDIITAEVLTGQIDSTLGLFQIVGRFHHQEGILIAVDDDGGQGVLSKIVFEIPEDGRYAIAVSTYPDFDFNGDGNTDPVYGHGRYVLSITKN